MRSGVFPIESLALSFTDENELNVLTKLQTVVLMLRATITGDLIAANANQDLLKMDGLAKVKQGPVSESNVN